MLIPLKISRERALSALDAKILSVLEVYFEHPVLVIGLSQVDRMTVPARSVVISTVEAHQPLLSTVSEQDMKFIKVITENASKVMWITNSDLLYGARPEFALVLGLSRALMLEQPSIQFSVFDVDDVSMDLDTTAQNIKSTMRQLLEDPDPDFEFAQSRGVVHVLRWEPEEPLNKQFRIKQSEETVDVDLESASRSQLSIKQPGQLDTIHFKKKDYGDALKTDQVEIQVKSVGMNAKVCRFRRVCIKQLRTLSLW